MVEAAGRGDSLGASWKIVRRISMPWSKLHGGAAAYRWTGINRQRGAGVGKVEGKSPGVMLGRLMASRVLKQAGRRRNRSSLLYSESDGFDVVKCRGMLNLLDLFISPAVRTVIRSLPR